jgi:hypothetical protein
MVIRHGPVAFLAAAMITVTACSQRAGTISIHDRFIPSADCTVLDLCTGIIWKRGPDTNMSCGEARAWIDDLGGGWRMPTVSELMEIFRAGITTETWGPFDNTGWEVWGLKIPSGDQCCIVSFREPEVYVVRIMGYSSHGLDINAGQRVWAVLPSGKLPDPPTYIPQLDPI